MSADDSSMRHLDLDDLADHLVGGPAHPAGPADAHLAGCAGCRARLAELEAAQAQVTAGLRALPPLSLPADVAARLTAALTTAPPLSTQPATGLTAGPVCVELVADAPPPRRRASRPWVSAAAAVLVLVLGGVVGAAVVTRQAGPAGSTVGAPAGGAADAATAPAAPTFASGADYADPTATTGALTQSLAGAGAPVDPSAMTGPVTDDGLGRLRDPVALEDCLAAVLDGAAPGERPLALDYATYAGSPALAVVLPDPDPTRVAVFVVGPDCSRADGDLLFFTRVARP